MVIEAPAKQIALSFGIDDGTGVQLESLYRKNIFRYHDFPLILSTGLAIDRLRQRAFIDINFPSNSNENKDAIGLLADHSNIQDMKIIRLALGATNIRQICIKNNGKSIEYEKRLGSLLAYDYQTRIKDNASFQLSSITATFDWTKRNIDNKYNPRNGDLITFGFGLGSTINEVNPYARVKLRLQEWKSIGRSNVISSHLEIGKVYTKNSQFPYDFGFRSNIVRRKKSEIADSALALVSLEYEHDFTDKWGLGLFIETWNSENSFRSIGVNMDYGIGIRARTLASPLSLDLIYNQLEKKIRLHFSLGIVF
ncbi:MAG: BamA/TamA family outer membrane protein [Bordetella sp.]|nr:MAG: BamA/TamA family outer membrane protein [Bordetella sp.]